MLWMTWGKQDAPAILGEAELSCSTLSTDAISAISLTRRILFWKISAVAVLGLGSSSAAGQPFTLTMSDLAQKTLAELHATRRLEDVPAAVDEWNRRFRQAARRADRSAATDYQRIVDAIEGELRTEPMKRFLIATIPALRALLERVPAWLGPIFAFLQAMAPSSSATEFKMLYESNNIIQEEAYRVSARFLPPGWDVRISERLNVRAERPPGVNLLPPR